jgi:hypothetical protein
VGAVEKRGGKARVGVVNEEEFHGLSKVFQKRIRRMIRSKRF